MPRRKKRIVAGHSMKTLLGKSKRKRSAGKSHNPKLKLTLKRKGVRLVHGYETKRRSK